MLTRYPLRRGTATALLLEYRDAAGEQSMRTVMPLAIVTDEARKSSASTYLQARCSIAKAVRTFRLDRVESLNDPATGETAEVAHWLTTLTLGEGRPFAWSDEVGEDFGTPAEMDNQLPKRHGARIWRAVLLALLIGYLIGRLRLVHMVLLHFRTHHGLWL